MGEGTFIWVYRRGRVYREKCFRFVPHGFDLEEQVCICHSKRCEEDYLQPCDTFQITSSSICSRYQFSVASSVPRWCPRQQQLHCPCLLAAALLLEFVIPQPLPQSLAVILPRPEPSHRLG